MELWLSVIFCVLISMTPTSTQMSQSESAPLRPKPTYLIAAPSEVRASEVVQILVGLFELRYTYLHVHASIRRDGDEVAMVSEQFSRPAFRLLQLQMPDYAAVGNYTLLVEGLTSRGYGAPVFRNETKITFSPKQASVFVKTDKVVYMKKSRVRYRVIAIKPNLMPMSGSIDIFVKNGKGLVVRRWLGKQINHGIYTGSFPTGHPAGHGWWTIEVEGWGGRYQTRFKTENFFYVRYDLNVTMPPYVFDNEYGIAGVIMANNSQNGMSMHANATVNLEVIPPEDNAISSMIKQDIPMFKGVTTFMYTLTEIQNYTSTLAGTKLIAHVTMYDWYSGEEIPSKAHSEIYQSGARIRFLGGKVRTFKPGMPMMVYIAVYNSDGTKFVGKTSPVVYITTIARRRNGQTRSEDEKTYLIPDDSIVRYQFTPELDDEMISIRASYAGRDSTYSELRAYRHYTRSDHYLQVTSSTVTPKIDTYIVFTVKTSTYVPVVYYQLVANGNIIIANSIRMTSTQKTFSVAASRLMIPETKIVVFCLRNNGEVLADSLSFHVDGLLQNKIDLRINKGKDFTEDTIEITALTKPSTFIAFSAATYDLYKLGGHSFLTQHEVEEELLSYAGQGNSSFKHTWNLNQYRQHNQHFTAPSYAIDANTTFAFAGLLVFTDADLTRIPAWEICNETLGYSPCFDGSCFMLDQQCDGVWQCEDGADEMGCPDSSLDIPTLPDAFGNLERIWSHMDDFSWAWRSLYTKPDGRLDMRVKAPLRPLTWMISAVALNKDTGLELTDQPACVDLTRSFYIQVEVPKAAFRGEQLGVQVSVFNYWSQSLEALVTLAESSKYKFVLVEDNGVTSSYNPRTVGGDIQVMVYLLPGETRYVHFPILPIVMGKVSIEISASSPIRRQSVKKSVTISMDGVTNTYHTPYLIDLINKGSVIIPDLDIIVPERFIMPNQRAHLYVPGSQKATVSVVGDIVGPGFFTSVMDGYKMMKQVYGGGDHYLFSFGINIYWLKFLKWSNQLSQKTLDTALTGMTVVLDQIYPYIQKNGGMAYRRKRAPVDVWATSVALEVLSSGVVAEWEYALYVDIDILNKLALWLVQQQDPVSGAFRQSAPSYDMKLRSVLNSTDDIPMNISLTAQAVIGLATSSKLLTGDAQHLAVSSMTRAADYLASQIKLLNDTFEICISTYALHVANHRQRVYAMSRMDEFKREDSHVYWSPKIIPPIRTAVVGGVIPVLYPCEMPYPYSANAVQATAYALMVYLRNNRYVEAQPIMQWLQTQRHYDSAFVSSMDTLVATEALIAYAERNTNRDFQNMLIRMQSTATHGWLQSVHLQQGNFSKYNTHSIPNVFGTIRSSALGTGMALIQITTEVNVEYTRQLRRPHIRAFDLDIETLRFYGRNSSHLEMNVCIRWVATHIAPSSGAAILEVDIPTGFFVRKQMLRKYQRTGRIHSQRSRFTKQKVVLYIDYIDEEGSCWYFPGERWYPVANATIQHRITIYDTSEPGLFNTTIYTTYSMFNNHICQVCGSFQCPYCPFYNAATSHHLNMVNVLIHTLLGLISLWCLA